MDTESIAVDELLLILKIAFLVLLYLFIWRIVRTASRDIRAPQESFVLAPDRARHGGPAPQHARLVVIKSPTLREGSGFEVNSLPITIGRSSQNRIELRGDAYASSVHARVETRSDGTWLEDEGSTNGTFVNGTRIDRPRKLTPGDVVRVGETDLRFEL